MATLGQAPVDDILNPGDKNPVIIKSHSWRTWLTTIRTIVNSALAAIAALPTPAFTKFYNSGEQTITSAGALTLAHGLGSAPTLVQIWLKCKTAELGYSAGDLVTSFETTTNANGGVSIAADGTNLNVRFGSAALPLTVNNKTTGAASGITLANWKVVFLAWA